MQATEPKTLNKAMHRLAFVYMTAICLLAPTAAAFATTAVDDEYIDSVYSWGIWELELEPASGPQVSANNAINDRSRKLQFRPNDNAAYITRSVPVPAITTISSSPNLPPAPTPVVGASGSGPILPGMVPNSPNLR